MKTKNIIAAVTLVLITVLSNVTIAQEEKINNNEFADYAAGISLSPFGGSVGFTHNWNPKTSFQAALGGFSGTAPISPEINGISYDIDNSTSWIGMFINHRPFADADWFRLGTGIGVGTIKNTLTVGGGTDQYQADYEGNIVGYVGVGFGGRPKKGLIYSGSNLLIKHLGEKSSFAVKPRFKVDYIKLRNWHLMWSSFYYYKNYYQPYIHNNEKVYL